MSKRIKKAQVWIAHLTENGVAHVLLFRVVHSRGGGWHPVTGGVDKGETFEEGAQRELQEETGIDPAKGKWIDLKHETQFDGRNGPAVEQAFLFILEGKRVHPTLDPSEHTEFEWVELNKASQWVGFEGQKDALKLVSGILKAK